MSKISASEFQTWESLYWPEGIPRKKTDVVLDLRQIISNLDDSWGFTSEGRTVEKKGFVNQVDSIKSNLERESGSCASALDVDPLTVLTTTAACFSSRASCLVIPDLKAAGAPPGVGVRIGEGANRESIVVEALKGDATAWKPTDPSLSMIFGRDSRAVYAYNDLYFALESFLSFFDLRSESSIAIVGSLEREFELFIAVSAMAAGVPLVFLKTLSELGKLSSHPPSSVFVGRKIAANLDNPEAQEFRSSVRQMRKILSYLAVEGPVDGRLTRSLEKSIDIPVLQLFGVSGRGIVLANPREFNVHGSVGIPITNLEAVIADNLEEKSTRERMLMGPGIEGELAIRGEFINPMRDVGDPNQLRTRIAIGMMGTEWLGTGVNGKMDENGYAYLLSASFK